MNGPRGPVDIAWAAMAAILVAMVILAWQHPQPNDTGEGRCVPVALTAPEGMGLEYDGIQWTDQDWNIIGYSAEEDSPIYVRKSCAVRTEGN